MNPHGHTAQYVTIAIALRIQLVEYFERAAMIGKKFSLDGNEELEARRLTIVLLTAALCESCINAALALTLEPADFNKIERKPPLVKWFDHSKRVNPAFALDPNSADGKELEFLIKCRNSTTHARPEVYTETETIHPGNHEPWAFLNHDRVLPIVTLPVTLLQRLCEGTKPLIAIMPTSVAWQLRLIEFQTPPQN